MSNTRLTCPSLSHCLYPLVEAVAVIEAEGAINKSIEVVAVEKSIEGIAVVETSSSVAVAVVEAAVETSASSSVEAVAVAVESTETITTETTVKETKETFVHAEVVEESSFKVEYEGKAEVVGMAISKEVIEP